MKLLGNQCSFPCSSFAPEDLLLKRILLTHDPDGHDLDCEELLRRVEDIICHTTTSESSVSDDARGISCEIEPLGSEEPLRHTLFKISHEIMSTSGEQEKMIPLFDLLGQYAWDAKLALVLAAFAMSYGKIWLILQLDPHNTLAASVALLRKLPRDASTVKHRFKALILLVREMIDLTRCVVSFESLPLQQIELDGEMMIHVKSQIYKVSYWVVRSTLTCSAKISDLIATNLEDSTRAAIAVWKLSCLVEKLSSIGSQLRVDVNLCHQQIESKMHEKLLQLFKESHTDNQEVLSLLFPPNDRFPLKDCSTRSEHSLSQLKNEVVILFISKLDILSTEALFLLVQQQYKHPQIENLDGRYVIVWFPIELSSMWTKSAKRSFIFFSKTLSFYSIRRPWLLSPIILNYIEHTWIFQNEEPIMVVLDSQGLVTHSNALDMMVIWGSKAYPFSTSREKDIWDQQKWTLYFLIDDIDELLSSWVEQGENVCIYGGCNLEWIKELNAKIKEIINSDVRLRMVYAGTGRKTSENVKSIVAISDDVKHIYYLPSTKIQFLWLRIESMRRSRLRLGHTRGSDQILDELEVLLDVSTNEDGWVIIGNVTDMMKFRGREVLQCLDLFHVWGNNVADLGFMGALRASADRTSRHTESCGHTMIIPYAEGSLEKTIICDKCKQPMEKLVVYQ